MTREELYNNYKLGLIKLEDMDIIDLLSILDLVEQDLSSVIKEIQTKKTELLEETPNND